MLLYEDPGGSCDSSRLRCVRLCRGDLTKDERKAYLDGVLCLLKLPSKLDSKQFPGAHSRYDDFVVVHMNQTLQIHGTVRKPQRGANQGV
jgi:tyrosinase